MSAKKSLRQYRAAKVAEFQFKQRLERIEWEEEVLNPEMERVALEMNTSLEIPQYIVHED